MFELKHMNLKLFYKPVDDIKRCRIKLVTSISIANYRHILLIGSSKLELFGNTYAIGRIGDYYDGATSLMLMNGVTNSDSFLMPVMTESWFRFIRISRIFDPAKRRNELVLRAWKTRLGFRSSVMSYGGSFINDIGRRRGRDTEGNAMCPWPNRIVCRIMVSHKSFILRPILPLVSAIEKKKAGETFEIKTIVIRNKKKKKKKKKKEKKKKPRVHSRKSWEGKKRGRRNGTMRCQKVAICRAELQVLSFFFIVSLYFSFLLERHSSTFCNLPERGSGERGREIDRRGEGGRRREFEGEPWELLIYGGNLLLLLLLLAAALH